MRKSKSNFFCRLNSSQSTSETRVKKSVKKRKIIEKDILLECEALECLDENVFEVPKPSKKIQKMQSIDPTTVQCSRKITLLDPFHSTQSVTITHLIP